MDRPVKMEVTFIDVTVSNAPVVLDGWSFLASIEGTPAGNIIHSIRTDVEVPERYRTASDYCEHCHSNRSRNRLYIVMDKDGNTKQIGSTCIRSYLGIDPTVLVQHAEWLQEIVDATGDDDYENWGREHVSYTIPTTDFLALALAVSNKYGYVSGKMVYEGYQGSTTAYRAEDIYWTPFNKLTSEEKELMNSLSEYKEEVEKMVEWVKALPEPRNDYQHNLYTIIMAGYVAPKSAGLAASLLPTYRRAMEQLREREARVASEWLGEEGKRIPIKARVLSIIDSEGYYGVTYIHRMITEAGNALTWFSSSARLEEGAWYVGKGTIKKHEMYKNQKQTVISRFAGEVA
jgi:hypothetical protein